VNHAIRHLVNTEHAIDFIEAMPAHKIDLSWWTRGQARRGVTPFLWAVPASQVLDPTNTNVRACFGGILACDPFFQQQGVRRSWVSGKPLMFVNGSRKTPRQTVEYLFGDDASALIFYPRSLSEWPRSEHKRTLLARLRHHHRTLLRCEFYEAPIERTARAKRVEAAMAEGA
jgi:hypothetical protein